MGHEHSLIKEKPGPVFDFQLDYISSIVISGYKWASSQWSCGIFMSKTGMLMNATVFSEPFQLTASGSRNGLSTLVLWTFISTHSYDKQVKMIAGCLQLAEYVVERLKVLEKEISTELWIHCSTLSLAVVFRKPNDKLIYKYSLFCKTVYINNEECYYCHIYVMPSVTQYTNDQLIDELNKTDAFM